MLSSNLKQHVTQLVSDLTRCLEYCDQILVNRRVGKKHEHLDNLRATLGSSINAIERQFRTLQRIVGSEMEVGDDMSRHAVKACIRELEMQIHPHLSDVANKRTNTLPGFRDIRRHIDMIQESVRDALQFQADRLQAAAAAKKAEVPKPTAPPAEAPKSKKPDEIVIQLKELEKYTDHMKNSWYERSLGGKIIYVNCFDDQKVEWDRPSGYIKELPKPRRMPSYERRSPSPRRRSGGYGSEYSYGSSAW